MPAADALSYQAFSTQVDSIVDGLHDLGVSGDLITMQEGEWAALVV